MKFLDKDKILFCDNHLLIAVKPAGLLTQPNYGMKENFQDELKEYLKKKYEKKTIFLHSIHRLDKVVSGIVVFARSSKALSRLQKQVREQSIKRIYFALVEGKLEPNKNKLIHYLIHGSHRSILATKEDAKAKKAILSYRVIKYLKEDTLVEIQLETGRYHQIRAQFAAIGHPIIGDKKYGSKKDGKNSIKLHSGYVALEHPVSKKKMAFESKPSFF